MTTYLFTYGTLREGEALAGVIEPDAQRIPATVQGNLYHYGAFPVANMRTGWGRIVGEIVGVADDTFDYLAGMELRAGYEAIHVNARWTDSDGREQSSRVLAFHHPDAQLATDANRADADDYGADYDRLPRIPGDDWKREREADTDSYHLQGELR